jgi:preprotein translocase subunit YajC
LLVLLAQAQEAQSSSPGLIGLLIPAALFFFIFYFIVMRPQAKQQRELKSFVDKLAKGDEVVAANGVLGKVDKVMGDVVFVEVGGNLKLRVLKSAITAPPAYKAAVEEKPAAVVEEPKK